MIIGNSAAVPSAGKSDAYDATNSRGESLRRMAAPRVLRLLTILAVLLMPFGMLRGRSAEAMGPHGAMTMAAGHSADMGTNEKKAPKAPCCDCMVACAAIHSRDAQIERVAPSPMAAQPSALKPAMHGLHPKAATPPPRTA